MIFSLFNSCVHKNRQSHKFAGEEETFFTKIGQGTSKPDRAAARNSLMRNAEESSHHLDLQASDNSDSFSKQISGRVVLERLPLR